MILFVSGRCDIPAYYSTWFFTRLEEGFVDVRNPFNPHQISRIQLNPQNIDVIVFCTKNPIPIMNKLDEVPFPFQMQVTFTPYREDIERLPNKKEILQSILTLADKLGEDRLVVRYDPIFLSEVYTIEYHEVAFTKLCKTLQGRVGKIIISFVDMYKNTKANMETMRMVEMNEASMRKIGEVFGKISKQYGILVQTCAEKIDLSEFGIIKGLCMDQKELEKIAGHSLSHIKGKGVRNTCACMNSVDIGDYNCCAHHCLYCYANYDAKQIEDRMKLHDSKSSVLIGHIEAEDYIVERKEKSVLQDTLF